MTEHPIEVALAIHNKVTQGAEQEAREHYAVQLGELGLFSSRSIALIVDLSYHTVGRLTGKKDKTGGRFNPEALPLIYDLWAEYNQGGRNRKLAATIVKLGISPSYLATITGIPSTTLSRWVDKENGDS